MSELTDFEWDAGNRDKVLKRMPIETAQSAFLGEPSVYLDDKHSADEERWFLMNQVDDRPIALIFTVRNEKIRIISARYMHKKEESCYDKKNRP